MHTEMWEHPATRANVDTLRAPRRASSSSPRSAGSPAPTPARAGCPSPRRSSPWPAACWRGAPTRAAVADLAGRRVVVSAGGTREPLDPVRFLGNRSSGRQGYALAETAAARGAEVVLVSANVALPDPAGVDVVRVGHARRSCDAAVRAAAAERRRRRDGRGGGRLPAGRHGRRRKIKKGAERPAADRPGPQRRRAAPAWSTGAPRAGQVIVGFAAETGDADARLARRTAGPSSRAKGCDLLVVNGWATGWASRWPTTPPWCSAPTAAGPRCRSGPKEDLADVVWDLVAARLDPLAAR